jgi:hypothetical protein
LSGKTFFAGNLKCLAGNHISLQGKMIPFRESGSLKGIPNSFLEKTKALRKSEKFIENQKSFKGMKKVYKNSWNLERNQKSLQEIRKALRE